MCIFKVIHRVGNATVHRTEELCTIVQCLSEQSCILVQVKLKCYIFSVRIVESDSSKQEGAAGSLPSDSVGGTAVH